MPDELPPRLDPETREAWTTLYRRHHHDVVRILRSKNPSLDVDELVQRSFLKIMVRYRSPAALETPKALWLHASWNLARDHHRRSDVAGYVDQDVESARGFDEPQDDVAHFRQIQGAIEDAIAQLPAREQRALRCHLEGGSVSALAEAENLTAARMRVLLSQARRKIREILGPRFPDLERYARLMDEKNSNKGRAPKETP
jgi:RNA polymerase sigma factor (sigma-70 family)